MEGIFLRNIGTFASFWLPVGIGLEDVFDLSYSENCPSSDLGTACEGHA